MASSLDEVITSTEFLSSAASDERDIAGDLAALQGELGVLQGQLVVLEQDSASGRGPAPRSQGCSRTGDAADQAAWEKLSGECANLQKQYEIEVARAAAARGGGAAGVPRPRLPVSGVLSLVPPSPTRGVTPARVGRAHKGTDMMGPYGAPLYASASGIVYTGNSGSRRPDRLGGSRLWSRLLLRPPLRLQRFQRVEGVDRRRRRLQRRLRERLRRRSPPPFRDSPRRTGGGGRQPLSNPCFGLPVTSTCGRQTRRTRIRSKSSRPPTRTPASSNAAGSTRFASRSSWPTCRPAPPGTACPARSGRHGRNRALLLPAAPARADGSAGFRAETAPGRRDPQPDRCLAGDPHRARSHRRQPRRRHLSMELPYLPVKGKRHLDRILGNDLMIRMSEMTEEELSEAATELTELEAEMSGLRQEVLGRSRSTPKRGHRPVQERPG